MSRTRILTSIAGAALGIALLGACSTESLTEAAVNFGLEQAIEGNEDINLDFGDDGSGGISISTEEGDFALNFDEDNGGIIFDTDEGEGVISFDEDGIVFNTDQGDGTISFDQENGEIVFDTDQGDGTISFDEENGSVSFEGDDGSATFGTSQVPEDWPAAIGIPQTVNTETMYFSSIDTPEGRVLTAAFDHADGDPFAEAAVNSLVENGWEITEQLSPIGIRQVHLQNGDSTAMVVAHGSVYSTVTITLAS